MPDPAHWDVWWSNHQHLYSFTYTNDGDGGGSSHAEANPQKKGSGHGAILAVHRNEEVGEELNDHASEGEIRNGHLQLGHEHRVNEGLEHAAENALNDDKTPTNERERMEETRRRWRVCRTHPSDRCHSASRRR